MPYNLTPFNFVEACLVYVSMLMLIHLIVGPTVTVKKSGYVLGSPTTDCVPLLRILFLHADGYPGHQSLSSMLTVICS